MAGRKNTSIFGKRYGRGRGKKGGRQLVADIVKVARMARLMNVEIKDKDYNAVAQVVGQMNGDLAGYYSADITPVIAQGVGYADRTGNSVKLLSCALKMKFWGQSAKTTHQKLRVEIFRMNMLPVTVSTFISDRYENEIGSNIIGYGSILDPDYKKSYKFTKLLTREFSLIAPHYNGQVVPKDMTFNFKIQKHLVMALNSSTVTDGQIILYITCDNGNRSTTTTTTNSNVPVLAINTGVQFNLDANFKFTDN